MRVVTDAGAFTVLFYADAAPATVALYKAWIEEGYFEGREFNRVVPGHVIQVIDKVGGFSEDARRVPLEAHESYHFSAGAAGVARAADPDSGGPEWFVMDFATSHLDGNFTVWGQVVEGLDVVRAIARVPAVAVPSQPPLSDFFTDRQPVRAPVIRSASLVTVTLSPREAAMLPLEVALNARVGDYRHSLEWPRSIAAGATWDLTWFVRPFNGTAPPRAGEVTVQVGGASLPVTEVLEAPGAFRFSWRPPASGDWNATLVRDGEPMATLAVRVPT